MNGTDAQEVALAEYWEKVYAEMEAVGECGHIPPFFYVAPVEQDDDDG